jgi:hypothetical protein
MKLACCGTESLLFIKRQYLVGIIRVLYRVSWVQISARLPAIFSDIFHGFAKPPAPPRYIPEEYLNLCEIWYAHGGEYQHYGLPGYNAVQFGGYEETTASNL